MSSTAIVPLLANFAVIDASFKIVSIAEQLKFSNVSANLVAVKYSSNTLFLV